MFPPVDNLYQKLGLLDSLHFSQNIHALNDYVGTPMYPWLLVAMRKYLAVDEEPNERTRLENFFTFCFLGYLAIYTSSNIVLNKTTPNKHLDINHSDLLNIYVECASILPRAFDGNLYTIHFVEWYKDFKEKEKMTNDTAWGKDLKDLETLQTVENFCIWFRILLEKLETKQFGNSDLYAYFRKGYYKFWYEQIDEFVPKRRISAAFTTYRTSKNNDYQNINNSLREIYSITGIPFVLKSRSVNSSKLVIEYNYRNQYLQEEVDTNLHFVKPIPEKEKQGTYFGLLLPVVDQKKTMKLQLDHWLYL